MKKLIIAVILCLAMVCLMVAPVAAAAPPKLDFTTGLMVDTKVASGSYNGGFKIPTCGD
jgi:uncharacterized protein involved in exopolysaccharide biosynthesis